MKEKNSILKQYCHYTFFSILGMIGLSIYIIADTFFVSKGLGTNGLAALNLAIPIYNIIHGTGLLLGIGGAAKYSIYKGQKDNKNADIIFTNTLYVTVMLSLLFMFIAINFSEKLCLFLGADKTIFAMTNTYIKILLLFSPAFLCNNVLICFVRNDGKPQLCMIAMLAGSLFNIVMDYILIFPFQMGILGAVFATGLSPVVSMFLLSYHYISKTKGFHIIKSKLVCHKIAWIFLMGFPCFIAQISYGIVMIILNKIILSLQGNIGVAAYGVIANLSLVMTAVFSGLEQGIQPLFSQYYACNEKYNTIKILRYAVITVILSSIVIYSTIFIFSENIVQLFNSENNLQMQSIAVYGLKLYFTATLFTGMNIVFCIFFTSTENVIPAHVLSLLKGLILIIPMAYLLSALWGITGVWLCYAVTECTVTILAIAFYIKKCTQI